MLRLTEVILRVASFLSVSVELPVECSDPDVKNLRRFRFIAPDFCEGLLDSRPFNFCHCHTDPADDLLIVQHR